MLRDLISGSFFSWIFRLTHTHKESLNPKSLRVVAADQSSRRRDSEIERERGRIREGERKQEKRRRKVAVVWKEVEMKGGLLWLPPVSDHTHNVYMCM